MSIYSRDEVLIDAGAKPYYLGTNWMWYANNDKSQVSVNAIDFALNRIISDGRLKGQLLVINIEEFIPWFDIELAITNLKVAALRLKSTNPNWPIGIFAMTTHRSISLPIALQNRNYVWDSKEYLRLENRAKEWRNENSHISSALAPYVDCMIPSLYAAKPISDDESEEVNCFNWRIWADANIREAYNTACGLPVCPMLMPSYGTKPIELNKWNMMINYVILHPLVSSLIIHSSPNLQSLPTWREPLFSFVNHLIDS